MNTLALGVALCIFGGLALDMKAYCMGSILLVFGLMFVVTNLA